MSMKKSRLEQLILDSIPVAMVTVDLDYTITSFNTYAEKLTGYVADEAIGRPCHEILNSSRCGEDCPLRTALSVSELSPYTEAEIVNRHGEHVYIKNTHVSLLAEDKSFVGYLEVIEDISRQKRREREKMNFISMLAHDMKSPLFGISGLVNSLKKEKICETNEKLRTYLMAIGEAEQRLEIMVRDFLEYSHLVSGQVTLELSTTDIKKILLQVMEIYRLRAEEKHIVLTFESGQLSTIIADTNRLYRVFSNIIDNAIKYSPEKTEVTIMARDAGDEIVVSISDQGWGIEAEEIPYIFDAFYRTASIQKESGQGLGLAASRTVIRQHGGRISVKSRVGKGSVFTVHLPKERQKLLPDTS